jgi:hypothetical protein
MTAQAPAASAPGRPATQLVWLHPLLCVALIFLVYTSFIAFDFTRFVPNAYIPGPHYLWGGVLLLALAVGIGLAIAVSPPAAAPPAFDLPRAAMGALLVLTLLAYLVWFGPLLLQPELLLQVLTGESMNLRGSLATTPGVTTMTQFGVAYVIGHAALRGSRVRPLAAWEHLGFWLVLLLATVRVVAWSERLAAIELIVAFVVTRLAFVRIEHAAAWRLASVLPLFAPALLYAAFTATEYFRSWEFYRDQYSSIWQFSFERLIAYYATAANNGAGLLTEDNHWPVYTGRYVAEWLYLMPGLGARLQAALGDAQSMYIDFLDRFARPEFNNPTGLFTVVFDVGYLGSVLYFLACGAWVGLLWNGWRRRQPAGVLFHPMAMMFLVELLRFNYFAATRFFPIALALVALWCVARPVAFAARPGSRTMRATSATWASPRQG